MKINPFNFNLKKFLSITFLLPLFLVELNNANLKSYSDDKFIAATDADLYLYKGMGASYLCIATKAGVEFPKAVGIATATYVQVIEGKHGGLVKELGKKKLAREKLFAGAEFQIVTTAMKYCPNSVPKEVSKKVNKIIKENKKK